MPWYLVLVLLYLNIFQAATFGLEDKDNPNGLSQIENQHHNHKYVIKRREVVLEMKVKTDNETHILQQNNDPNAKLIKLQKPINDKLMQEFFEHFSNATLKQINELENVFDSNIDMKKILSNAEGTFKKQYDNYVKNKKVGNKDLDKVLAVIDTMYFVKHFTDNLMDLLVTKALEIDPKLHIGKTLYGAFNGLLDETNEHVCKEFGICRDFHKFRIFFTNFINIILKGNSDKIKGAFDSYVEVFEKVEPLIVPTVTQFKNDSTKISLSVFPKVNPALSKLDFKNEKTFPPDFAKIPWIDLRDSFIDPEWSHSKLKPINDAKVKILTGLDNIIPAIPKNLAIWKSLTNDIREFMTSDNNSATPIFQMLEKHLSNYLKLLKEEKLI